jgi:hypothetical protein
MGYALYFIPSISPRVRVSPVSREVHNILLLDIVRFSGGRSGREVNLSSSITSEIPHGQVIQRGSGDELVLSDFHDSISLMENSFSFLYNALYVILFNSGGIGRGLWIPVSRDTIVFAI